MVRPSPALARKLAESNVALLWLVKAILAFSGVEGLTKDRDQPHLGDRCCGEGLRCVGRELRKQSPDLCQCSSKNGHSCSPRVHLQIDRICSQSSIIITRNPARRLFTTAQGLVRKRQKACLSFSTPEISSHPCQGCSVQLTTAGRGSVASRVVWGSSRKICKSALTLLPFG